MTKLVALALCLAASSAFADTPLPDLGSSGSSGWFREERPREPPGTQFPLVFDRRTLPPERGSPWYWEEQPLYVPPVP